MKKKRLITIGVILFLIIGIILYIYFENTIIEVTKIDIKDSDIPKSFNNYKIVQVSDLHNAEFGRNNKKLLDKIKRSNPDAIFITGDLIDSSKINIDIAMSFVDKAIKIAPIYYVTGNHEAAFKGYDKLEKKFEDKGVVILDNNSIELKQGDDRINLIGFADPNFSNYYIDDVSIFSEYLKDMKLNTNSYTILLSHRPEMFDYYVKENINLVFSGHSHGGQFRIPFIGGVIAPNQGLFPKYASGVYKKNNTQMVVSRGLGNSIIPFRINNNPELVVVTLKNK